MVPERGREWRQTDSKIKGLRSYNNWVKSSLIQKFIGDERNLKILDIGCGKGGDLQMWQAAPQVAVDDAGGLDHEVGGQQVRHPAQRDVDRHRHHRQFGRPQHHHGQRYLAIPRSELSKKFSVAGMFEARTIEHAFGNRIGDKRAGMASLAPAPFEAPRRCELPFVAAPVAPVVVVVVIVVVRRRS